MISEKLQNAINAQITAEMWSANLYLSMSFYLQKNSRRKNLTMHTIWLTTL